MIYSHPCLTASLSLHVFLVGISIPRVSGADDRDRTCDPRFTKPLLYQLSYIGMTAPVYQNNLYPATDHLRSQPGADGSSALVYWKS